MTADLACLVAFLDATVEHAKAAGVRLARIEVDVAHDEWMAVCELLQVRHGGVSSCVVGLWHGIAVEAHLRAPEPKKRRRAAGTAPGASP